MSTKIKVAEAPTITILAQDGRDLLKIHPDGRVEGEIEDASEAGRRFVEAIRGEYRPKREDVDRVARVMLAAWEEAEGAPVNPSYVATFADMARAVLRGWGN